jgi:hypothetical protein
MKTLVGLLVATGLVLVVGCNDKSSAGGGSSKNEQFKISVKDTFKQGETVKQGETKKITINVDRGKEFKEDVKLSVEDKDVPKGVKVSFDPAEVPADKSTSEMTVKVDDKDSPPGKQTITVHAKPGKGSATSLPIEVTIEAAKDKSSK